MAFRRAARILDSMNSTKVAFVLVPLLACACAKPPKDLAGEYARVSVTEAQAAPRSGEAVRWGGKVVSMRPEKSQTCFEIAAFKLDDQARPLPSDESPGRFIACAPYYYEPSVYVPGREVTVVGALHGTTVRKVGDYDYTFPRVDATTVYLWPERPQAPPSPWYPQIGISVGGVF
jgi:outer membrane lipoprotein